MSISAEVDELLGKLLTTEVKKFNNLVKHTFLAEYAEPATFTA